VREGLAPEKALPKPAETYKDFISESTLPPTRLQVRLSIH
jgi:hypothetical protein